MNLRIDDAPSTTHLRHVPCCRRGRTDDCAIRDIEMDDSYCMERSTPIAVNQCGAEYMSGPFRGKLSVSSKPSQALDVPFHTLVSSITKIETHANPRLLV
jgi:hypothetical protein